MYILSVNPSLGRLLLLVACLIQLGCQTAPSGALSQAQVETLQQEGFKLTDEGWELGLSGKLLFGFDDDQLEPAGSDKVRQLTQTLLDVGIQKIRLDGHTDSIGGDSYNRTLSRRRASTVAEEMVNSGMARSQIEVRALGNSRPIASNATARGRSENRRVAIVVVTS